MKKQFTLTSFKGAEMKRGRTEVEAERHRNAQRKLNAEVAKAREGGKRGKR